MSGDCFLNKGLVHIYTGDGKGKTTAAIGLAVRFAGTGGRVLFVRFLKNNDSAELEALKNIPEITVADNPEVYRMIYLNGDLPEGSKEYYSAMFEAAKNEALSGAYGMIVFDELMAAVNLGLVDLNAVVNFLENRPEGLEVVMTGRNPAPEIAAYADYISEIKKIKHPFDQGITARKGIEY